MRVDIVYTLIHRLGLFRVALFFTVDPLWDLAVGKLHVLGVPSFALDALWPGVSDEPWVGCVLYLVLFDFADYVLHRAQHRFDWWWQLHALHHSQRQMTMWTDNRNHLLDDLVRDSAFVLLAHLGIWSRRDPWAPAVLEPLIAGLKQRGFCFATLREHPAFA